MHLAPLAKEAWPDFEEQQEMVVPRVQLLEREALA
jgi:hypothetical protein